MSTESPKSSTHTNNCRYICCLCGGSDLSSLPRQSRLHTAFTGNPAPGHRAHREADLEAPTWSHFQLLSPWREDSQGNVPPANLSLADCLSSQPRHAAHPFFPLSLSHGTHFFPRNPHTVDWLAHPEQRGNTQTMS